MPIPAGTEALGNAVNQSHDTIRKFLSEPQVRALLVARHNLKDEEESIKEQYSFNPSVIFFCHSRIGYFKTSLLYALGL